MFVINDLTFTSQLNVPLSWVFVPLDVPLIRGLTGGGGASQS
jgi:hypothetical protein